MLWLLCASSKWLVSVVNSQFGDEYGQLLDRLHLDEGLGKGREDQLIWLLWHQKEEAWNRVKEWEMALRDMNVCHGSVRQALRVCILSLLKF